MSAHSYFGAQSPVTDAQLEAFVAVADHGSFTRAAKQLRVTQSAVSHAVTALEESLRVDLLIRNARGIQLTDIGQRTVAGAREVLRLKALMRQDAEDTRRLRKGVVRVGSFGTTSSRHLLPPILEGFARRFPELDVHVIEGSDDEVEEWLREGRLDAGFVTLPNDEFDAVLLARDEMVVILPESSPLAGEARVKPGQLSDYPFIMSTGGCEPSIQKLVDEDQLDVQYRIREVHTIVEMVARGAGISIKPVLSLPGALPPGVVWRPLDPPCLRKVGLAFIDRKKLSPATSAFLKLAASQRQSD